MFQKIKEYLFKAATDEIKYYRPTLRITFLNGDVVEAVPEYWHRGSSNNWNLYYVDDGVMFNRYPITAIKEVEILSEECRTLITYDNSLTPVYATTAQLDKKIFRKRRFGG